MVVRNFSPAGGLELYAHKVIEGLLERGAKVTVFCQTVETEHTHKNLEIQPIELRPQGLSKAERLDHDYNAGNRALRNATEFDIIHSQHYPIATADVVTFHNHAVMRWSEVGLGWERLINETKFRLVRAYKLRDFHDRTLCASAKCLVFPSNVMQEDFYGSYSFLQMAGKPFVVAYPGSSLLRGTEELEDDSEEGAKSKNGGDNSRTGADEGDGGIFSFLFVGRGYRRKGLDILLAACSKLAKERSDFQLFIAGLSAKPIDKLRLMMLGIEDKVQYLGFQHDMEKVYARASAAVLPSRVEPFGMAPLQAMECGLVPVVSRVSGASEVLTDGVDSLILENHLDATELAGHMNRLMNDPALMRRLAAGARKTAANVNWVQTVDNTLHAYELALSQKNARFPAAVK